MSAMKTTIKIILLFLAGLIVGSLCAGSFTTKAQNNLTEVKKPTSTTTTGNYAYTGKLWKGYRSYKVSIYNDKEEIIKQINDCRNIKMENDYIELTIKTNSNKVVVEEE